MARYDPQYSRQPYANTLKLPFWVQSLKQSEELFPVGVVESRALICHLERPALICSFTPYPNVYLICLLGIFYCVGQ